ncbi:hypothetical protein BKA65DRAFT_147584 [Rhexocercosporidium sp. MPI-PUGE-AT-0058]|nr:hypothetical protein BKA65DRAFT_147584 [Rhexocercosporidium sp. MPI-PUGE-AT-0058]
MDSLSLVICLAPYVTSFVPSPPIVMCIYRGLRAISTNLKVGGYVPCFPIWNVILHLYLSHPFNSPV